MAIDFIYHTYNDLNLEATFYPPGTSKSKGIILYFHGGGLIYGYRNDLPKAYLELFLEAGYGVITLDYPLIPEIRVDTIINSLEQGIINLKELPLLQNENWDQLTYFGRSAGAYLMFQLANSKKLTPPKQLISFYGYYSLENQLLIEPSSYYKSYPAVPYMTVHSLIQKLPLSSALIEQRFPIYLFYRQSGNWVKELLGKKNNIKDFSITKTELAQFPRTFIAASKADQDVPFNISYEMSQIIPNNTTFFTDNLPHDFDADLTNNTGLMAYESLLLWLDEEQKRD